MLKPTFGIAIVTNDRLAILDNNLKEHYQQCKKHGIKLYVFDDSEVVDNLPLMSKYLDVIYYKHTKHQGFDKAFRYAAENTPEEYVWVIGDKVTILPGAIPMIMDFLTEKKFSAIVVNCNARISLCGMPTIESEVIDVMAIYGWHTTLCGSVIYHKDTIARAEKNKYMGSGFIHTAMFLDGITKMDEPVLIMTHSLTTFNNELPRWIPDSLKIWTKDLHDMVQKLPQAYSQEAKIYFLNNNGFNGALFTDNQARFMARSGFLTNEVLDKYEPYLKKICWIPMERLRYIVKTEYPKYLDNKKKGILSPYEQAKRNQQGRGPKVDERTGFGSAEVPVRTESDTGTEWMQNIRATQAGGAGEDLHRDDWTRKIQRFLGLAKG